MVGAWLTLDIYESYQFHANLNAFSAVAESEIFKASSFNQDKPSFRLKEMDAH